jgi:methylphosphotriester-DNA--protein-cysteine methyltransferase
LIDNELKLRNAINEETPSSPTYILNTNTKRFHFPSCESVGSMKVKNRADFFGTREEAIQKGYKPCGNCNP